jgi:hypothetical protein
VTEWDQPLDDAEPSTGLVSTVFVGVAIGLAWLLCLPFDLFARLGQRSRSDALDEQTCADWGSEHIHNGDVSI